MIELFLTNTKTHAKEKFVPHADARVLMYVCGITPYDYSHIGHGRVYVSFDLLYRLLKLLNYKVTYCRNYTDIDDKILNRAQKELGDSALYMEIANRYIASFNENMKQLNCLKPDHEPRVTQTIPEIIKLIEELIAKGYAYEVAGDVYYYVPKFKDYGKLSGRKLEDLYVGARVEVNDIKKSPYDFALWKAEKEGTFWKSPWGYGRPGWHIECSAMAEKFLGYPIDIHGGGMDLIFPHHENEIAQSEGARGGEFVHYWVHTAFVNVNKEKMSKSLGNFITLNDIFAQFDPMVIRYYYVSHNIRAPLEFSPQALEAAKKSYQRVCHMFQGHSCEMDDRPLTLQEVMKSKVSSKMLSCLADDLNLSAMIAVLFEHSHEIKENKDEQCTTKRFLQTVVGFALIPLIEEIMITPEIQRLIDEREQARSVKDWKRADALRDQLKALGFEVQDKKS